MAQDLCKDRYDAELGKQIQRIAAHGAVGGNANGDAGPAHIVYARHPAPALAVGAGIVRDTGARPRQNFDIGVFEQEAMRGNGAGAQDPRLFAHCDRRHVMGVACPGAFRLRLGQVDLDTGVPIAVMPGRHAFEDI